MGMVNTGMNKNWQLSIKTRSLLTQMSLVRSSWLAIGGLGCSAGKLDMINPTYIYIVLSCTINNIKIYFIHVWNLFTVYPIFFFFSGYSLPSLLFLLLGFTNNVLLLLMQIYAFLLLDFHCSFLDTICNLESHSALQSNVFSNFMGVLMIKWTFYACISPMSVLHVSETMYTKQNDWLKDKLGDKNTSDSSAKSILNWKTLFPWHWMAVEQ